MLLPCILLITFFTTYVFICRMMAYDTDVSAHTVYANEFLDGAIKNSYPGYYLIFGFLSRVCGMPQIYAAASAVGLFSVMTGIAVYVISGCVLGWNGSERIRCLIVLFMLYFGPLYLGGDSYYLGPGSFNSWHNPTNSGVKFLALICFYLFMYVFHMEEHQTVSVFGKQLGRKQLNGILMILVVCSLVFKPSFFQVFAPFLAVVFVLDFLTRRRPFKEYFLDALIYVPGVLVILYQIFAELTPEQSGGGIFISFAMGWGFHTDNIFRAIMANAIFPLFVCVFCEKNLFKNKALLYSMLFYVVSLGEALLLVESGPRMYHGNFLWGMELGIGIGFMGAILCFVQYCQSIKENATLKQRAVCYVGNGLLAAHFILGVWYILSCIIMELEYF